MQDQANKITIYSILIFLLIGVLASFLMFWITGFDIGVSPDSTIYLDTAENILSGNGIMARNEPMTHYPPGYPVLLASASLFQPENIRQSARIFHVFIFGCNVFLIGLTVSLCTKNNIPAIGYVLLGFLASSTILTSHAMVWSDPPFITLVLLIIVLLTSYILRSNWYLLILIALLTGFAIMVRYIGITIIPAIILAILIFNTRPIKYKVIDIVIIIAITILPLIIWFSRNILVAQTATNRQGAFQFLGFNLNLSLLFAKLYDFVLPIPIPHWLKSLQFGLVILFIILGILFLQRKNYIKHNFYSPQVILPFIYIIFFVTYLSFLIFTQLFFEVRRAWDFRILLPAFLALIFITISIIWSLTQVVENKALPLLLFFIVLISIGVNGFIAISSIAYIHENGHGYTSQIWRNSIIIPSSEMIHDNQKLYSNGPDILHFRTKKIAAMIPRDKISGTPKQNLEYEEQLLQMCKEINEGKALLVYMDNIDRDYLPDLDEIETLCNSKLPVLQTSPDGTIYGIDKE